MKSTKKKDSVTYVALLRGINVGGNSLIKMKDLQAIFERLGFSDVRTYIASGNVLFRTAESDARKLEQKIEKALAAQYSFNPRVLLRNFEQMKKVASGIPKNWKDSDKRYNVIFLWPSIDSEEILEGLNPKEGIEEVVYRPGVLFWSANTGDITRTSMVKLSSKEIYREMTVRNLNTTKKLFELMKEIEAL